MATQYSYYDAGDTTGLKAALENLYRADDFDESTAIDQAVSNATWIEWDDQTQVLVAMGVTITTVRPADEELGDEGGEDVEYVDVYRSDGMWAGDESTELEGETGLDGETELDDETELDGAAGFRSPAGTYTWASAGGDLFLFRLDEYDAIRALRTGPLDWDAAVAARSALDLHDRGAAAAGFPPSSMGRITLDQGRIVGWDVEGTDVAHLAPDDQLPDGDYAWGASGGDVWLFPADQLPVLRGWSADPASFAERMVAASGTFVGVNIGLPGEGVGLATIANGHLGTWSLAGDLGTAVTPDDVLADNVAAHQAIFAQGAADRMTSLARQGNLLLIGDSHSFAALKAVEGGTRGRLQFKRNRLSANEFVCHGFPPAEVEAYVRPLLTPDNGYGYGDAARVRFHAP
jgi:hypothetical protein